MSTSSQNPKPTSARERLIGYALVALPNEPAFAKCDGLADAYRDEVLNEARKELNALQARLSAVLDLCDEAERAGIVSGHPFTVRRVQAAALGDEPQQVTS